MTNGPNRVYADQNRTICTVAGISNGGRWPKGDTIGPALHTEGKANARLIATAPEMLDALKESLAYISALHQAAHGRALPTNNAVANQIRDAIAKAEGEENES